MPLELDSWMDARSIRRQVLRRIAAKKPPHREDVIAALAPIPGEPIPQAIIDYVATYVRGTTQDTGRRARVLRRGTVYREWAVSMIYALLVEDLEQREEVKEVKRRAIKETADRFNISPRQVQRDLANYRRGTCKVIMTTSSTPA